VGDWVEVLDVKSEFAGRNVVGFCRTEKGGEELCSCAYLFMLKVCVAYKYCYAAFAWHITRVLVCTLRLDHLCLFSPDPSTGCQEGSLHHAGRRNVCQRARWESMHATLSGPQISKSQSFEMKAR